MSLLETRARLWGRIRNAAVPQSTLLPGLAFPGRPRVVMENRPRHRSGLAHDSGTDTDRPLTASVRAVSSSRPAGGVLKTASSPSSITGEELTPVAVVTINRK